MFSMSSVRGQMVADMQLCKCLQTLHLETGYTSQMMAGDQDPLEFFNDLHQSHPLKSLHF